ncbi:homoprotocatechuate degradation operon regulator HpaR [Gynuella sunshinyii]|uniref:Transcriptional regulator n=1 Tax=Gynuella sunshinyii YC6258 TaxID=1445510 RepID=A0A0C5VEG6_9GAMM|nr:homoprotocatechuate degradation operon regulator HpaR [Gynuella sunshinyii]AJQ97680.1 transcriptional regulator [Gynuella sunshinyii YC6258]
MREFRRSLPMSLLKAREAVMKKFIPHLKAQDLSPQQWRVLRALFDAEAGEMEMTTLADQCYLLMPSLSRIIQYLEKRQLIQRRTSELDMRRSIISLTPAGTDLVNLMAPQSEARYQYITEVFGYGKLELLYELLDELTDKLSNAEFDNGDDKKTK